MPRVKISLIKTGMGNATTADPPGNVTVPVAGKVKKAATAAAKVREKVIAADKACNTRTVVQASAALLPQNLKSKYQCIPGEGVANIFGTPFPVV